MAPGEPPNCRFWCSLSPWIFVTDIQREISLCVLIAILKKGEIKIGLEKKMAQCQAAREHT